MQDIRNVDLLIPVPPNSTYRGADLSGGSNLGPNPPTISVHNNVVDVHLDGPLAGGSTVTFPTVTAHLTASGAAGSTITTQLYGTSYADPGLTFTADVSTFFGTVSAPTSCYPNPNPVITTTKIS